MALSDSERWENIKGSVEKYATASLVTAAAIPADIFEGAKFNPASVPAYVRVRVFNLGGVQSFRKVNATDRGVDARLLVQIDCFVKVDLITAAPISGNLRYIDEILDTVHSYFKEGTTIPVYQLQSGGTPATQVATLFCMRGEPMHVLKDPEADEDSLQRRTYEAEFRWDKVLAA